MNSYLEEEKRLLKELKEKKRRKRIAGRKNIKKAHGVTSVPVIRSDGRFFESIASAAREIGVTPMAVTFQLEGKTKQCQGYTFEYLYPHEKRNWNIRLRKTSAPRLISVEELRTWTRI